MNYSEKLQAAIAALRDAKRVLVLTGAGISAESGIPTFRGGGGTDMWRGMPFDQLSSARLVEDDLPLLWDWFDYRRGVVGEARPNAAHDILARASRIKRYKSFVVVTQNIDGLHQAADTREVIELHGSLWRARCLTCGKTESLKVIPADERPPVCGECMDSMRPDVVLFGEALPATNFFTAQELAGRCDVCIVIGTSAQVYPAAGLPTRAQANGATVIEVNLEETELTATADIALHGKASEVLFDLFTFLEEPFEELEEIEELDVDFRLDEIRIDIEPEPLRSASEEEQPPSLSFLMSDEFSSNRELVMKVGYEGAVAEINLFKPDDGQPFFFVSGTGLAHDENDGDHWVEWEPELVASVADGIRTIADGDKIFYSTGLFIGPEYRDEILAYLRDTVDSLPDAERRKLELFHRPVGADEWVAQTEQTMLSEKEETQVEGGFGSEEAEALPSGPFEGTVEPPESETASEENLADGHFLLFWRETSVTAAERLGRALDVISSNQLEGLRRGDTVWVATVEKGDLVVVGRMRVGEVIGREEAERRFGDDNIWKSNFFAVALDPDSCELPRRIYLGKDAYELRFMEDDADRFVRIDGRISRSQTRKMRQLTTGAAKMLVDVWEQDCESEVSDDDLEANVVFLGAGSDSEPEPVEVDGHRLDVFEGCLLGGAVGDALGAAIEFDSIEAIRREHGDDGLTDYAEAYGRIGSVTDDTQMTLFTAEGLLRAECRRSHRGICYPAGVIHHAYLRWLQTQGHILEDEAYTSFVYETPSWLRDVPEMNAVRAPGTTCLDALLSGKRGTPEEPINDRKGCGGVMRVAPIGLIALDPFGLASEAAAITHGHPTGYLSAGVFASVIGGLVKGDSLIDAIENAVYRELPKHEGHEETLAACEKAIRLAKSHLGSADGGFPEDESVPERPGPEAVEALGAGWIAEEALAIALYCSLVHENDFEKALLLSVNHSGDSDSTGSITGNILGTIHGKKGIPDRWLEHLELRGVISELARDLAVGFVDDFEWSRKYPGI